MNSDVALGDLLEALRAREVPIMRDDVQWAFSAKKSRQEVVNFVHQYLAAETLLSRDELDLYLRLERNGTVRDLTANHDLSLVRPILDDEIQLAVNALKASTLAIERQNESLKIQRAALSAFREQDKQTKVRGDSRKGLRHSKQEQEKQHVGLAVDELFQVVSSDLETSRHRLRAGTAMIPIILAEQLSRDDSLLSNLESLACGLTCLHGPDQESIDRSLTLCKALASYIAEGIRCRLDRIYMEASRPLGKGWVPTDGTDLCSTVQEEMSSLYSEIAAVAEMSVNCEFENPIVGQFKLKQGKDNDYASSVLDFLNATVSHLHRRADHFTTIVRTHQSYEMTVQMLAHELNSIHLHQPHDRMQPSAKPSIPKLDQSVKLQPIRVASSISRKPYISDSVSTPILSNSLGQLLGLLGIPSCVSCSCEEIRDILGVAALDREQTIRGHPSNHDLAGTLLPAHLGNAAETNQLLADVLYADSPTGRFSFVDRSIENSAVRLESAIDDLGRCMAGTSLGVLQHENRTKDAFVNRWAV